MKLKDKIKELYHAGKTIEEMSDSFMMHPSQVIKLLGTARHKHYVYHQEERVYARRGNEEPVLAETLESPQAAFLKVDSIVNPDGHGHARFGPEGFHHEDFQSKISERCRDYVEAAYAKA